MPMVYKDIIFQSRNSQVKVQATSADQILASGFDGVIATNIQLIRSLGMQKYAKEALIYMLTPAHFNLFLSTLLVIYREDMLFWTGVKMLRFTSTLGATVSPTTGVEIKTGIGQRDNQQRMLLVARFMEHAIPNVECLFLRGSSLDRITGVFFDRLQAQYSKGIRSIDNTLGTMIGDLSSANLTSLNISFDNKNLQMLPRIYSRSLKSLQLSQVPPSFSWSFFQTERDSQENIVFPELYCLKVAFMLNSNRVKLDKDPSDWRLEGNPDYPRKVYFPKLKSLHVNGKPELSDISFNDVFSKHIGKLIYTDNSCSHSAFSNSNVKSIGKLHCEMKPPLGDSMQGFYHETNFLLGKVDITQYALLDISFTQLQMDPRNVQWTNLTDLGVSGIDYEVLINLILRTPSLMGLTISNLRFTQIPDIFDIDEEYSRRISVRNVYVFGNPASNSKEGLVDCICHLILFARSIEKLGGGPRLTDRIQQFIEKHQWRYPRLSELCLVNNYKTEKGSTRLSL
ncbi:hypothetical protein LPJ56_000613 [Coemansia sp. RSA 2599]|nr:hypothetical protein LPJ75_000230 [Coemansia sp. RSA 2598]KAJ1829104.1 hypothetical protein LPJ56_000613 [Coemansia sp. RSA 2599]